MQTNGPKHLDVLDTCVFIQLENLPELNNNMNQNVMIHLHVRFH